MQYLVVGALATSPNHTELRILTPSPDDAAEVAELWRQSIARLCLRDHRGDSAIVAAWTANKTTNELAAAFAEPNLFWRIARLPQNRIVGVGLLGSEGAVRAVYVHPDHVGRGVGSSILTALEEIARASGHHVLNLESTATAHDFYCRHGFRNAGPSVEWNGVHAQPMTKAIPF